MSLKLTILGCHSATPRAEAYPTAQHLDLNNQHFLIDCGEGTQSQLRKYHCKFSRIKHVFISHLHGDHFFGLIGLISTFSLLNRVQELHVFGPKGLEEIINLQLKLTQSYIQFPLIFHELKSKQPEHILSSEKVDVFTIPLKHRIYTNGFLFREKFNERKLNMVAVSRYPEIEICDYQNIKNGKDFVLQSGEVIPNKNLTLDPPKPLSYAYCSDTAYTEKIINQISNVDLLYHESTFLEDKLSLAKKTKHSTAKQAALMAQKAQVKQLILGHYSSRYRSLDSFLKEAQPHFNNCVLSEPGQIHELKH